MGHSTADAIYYDPFDFDIDKNPYPLWKRMRDEQPLYFNDRYGFYALSRFHDVEAALKDHAHLISSKGTLIEVIKSGVTMPKGMVIFEDPPSHDVYRGLLARVFTPKKVQLLEAQARQYCSDELDKFVGADGFDFVRDLGAQMPARLMGKLMGVPESDLDEIREKIDHGLKLDSGGELPDANAMAAINESMLEGNFAEYLDWRAKNPSNDIMTELLTAEFEDHLGVRRTLTREEVLGYCRLLAAAGNETTTRLIGFTGKVLAEHPDARREVAADPSLINNTIEEVLRYETPAPMLARYVAADVEYCGQTIPEGSIVALLCGSANRDDRHFPLGDTFDIHRRIDHHLAFGYGVHFCLGASLARMEGRVALDEVLKRFPNWEVDYDNAVQAHTSTVRGWESLPVRIV